MSGQPGLDPVEAAVAATSGTTAATMGSGFKTVAASGTPERLAASSTLVTSIVLQGYKAQASANTGTVYVGTAATDASQPIAILTGASLSLSAPPGKFIDLNLIYLDVATNGDGVGYFYVS